MKKLFAILALVLGMVSCQTEPEALDVVVGGEQDVMLSVSLPEGTRANSAQGFDLANLNLSDYSIRYILEIKYNDRVVRDVQISKEKSVKFPVRLAPGRYYTFTVWADLVTETNFDKETWHTTDLYYNTSRGLANITFNDWTPNVEARDAWTATTTEEFGPANKNISLELKRPFAKVRVVATDIQEIRNFGLEPAAAVAEYAQEMYTEFDAVAGVAKGVTTGKTHTFNYDDVNTYEGANGEQLTVFADYVLVPADGNVQFTLSVYANEQRTDLIKTNNFNTTIPVVANKVTSIVGNVLTEGGDVKVTVDGVLGNHETFKYIDTAENLLAAMNEDGNFILGGNIELSDAPVAGQASRRNTANQAKKTTIDLNGYTITINNKGDKPLVTVAEGNTLTFAGAGNIVMTLESTAPFVENKNENGGVIIEEAKVTNNSTNQEATVVDGTAVVNEGVEIEGNVVSGETTSQLDYVLANGGEVTLLADVETDKPLAVSTTNAVVINGNGKTITYTGADRAFTVENTNAVKTANVTLNDLTFVNTASYSQRGINFNVAGKLTLNNVTVGKTGTPATYAINLPGSSDGAEVVINNSYLRGNIALNIWGEDMVINATNSEFYNYDNVEAENYTAIAINNDGATVADNCVLNIDGGKVIARDEKGEPSYAVRNSTITGVVNISSTTEVVGKIVKPEVIIAYEGHSEFYTCETLQRAINKAAETPTTATVRLFKNIEIDSTINIANDQTVTIDLNGHTITSKTTGNTNPQDVFLVKGNFTVKNGTITTEHVGDNLGWSAMTTIFDITAGGVVNLNGVTAKNLGGTDMGFVAHLNNWGEVTLNVENSTLESNYVAVRVFNSGYDMNNVTIKNSTLKGGSYAFWVHNYTVADFGTEEKAEAQKALLNFDIFNGTNTFIGKNETPIRYGMTNAIYTAPGTYVSSAEELEAAIKAGGEYVLGADIALDAPIQIEGKSFSINGNGFKIGQSSNYPAEGTAVAALIHPIGGEVTIKNVVFDSIKNDAAIRTAGTKILLDNITVTNCNHTKEQGLLRLLGQSTIKNSTFSNNTCEMVVSLNFDGNGDVTSPQVVENCEFIRNTCNTTAVLYYAEGGSATIDGNKFVNNTLNVGNGATVYLGFKKNCTVTNNLFDGNTVTATSKRSAGGLMVGNAAVVTGNAFVNNTVTVNGETGYGNDVCASPYYAAIDLSGNYWGGGAPVENDDYYKEYNNYEVIINDYLTANPFN